MILGFGGAPLWAAKCTYLTVSGNRYAEKSGKVAKDIVNQYFGLFFLIFQSSGVWGNLISSLIFGQTPTTGYNLSTSSYEHCGANDCPYLNITNANSASSTQPTQSLKYTLLGIYTGSGVLAIALIAIFLDNIDLNTRQAKDDFKEESFGKKIMATIRHLKDKRQCLLIPLTMYSGFEQGFLAGDYTKKKKELELIEIEIEKLKSEITPEVEDGTFAELLDKIERRVKDLEVKIKEGKRKKISRDKEDYEKGIQRNWNKHRNIRNLHHTQHHERNQIPPLQQGRKPNERVSKNMSHHNRDDIRRPYRKTSTPKGRYPLQHKPLTPRRRYNTFRNTRWENEQVRTPYNERRHISDWRTVNHNARVPHCNLATTTKPVESHPERISQVSFLGNLLEQREETRTALKKTWRERRDPPWSPVERKRPRREEDTERRD
ncbi:unc-93 homolog A [Pelobates cultripes]|uniref:Protein unc-93 homolog A n=1 Tax=Pelobates cultripes TaxID=61616 RepID=A0AAD1SW21_PELCU|nr:unc-93 homolog A [Pelobates cultripes]